MAMQSYGRFAGLLRRRPQRRERFEQWVRRTFRDGGPNLYADMVGIDLRTARGRFEGSYPPPDEEDRLIEMFGDDYLGPVIFPAFETFIQNQEAKARELEARNRSRRILLARHQKTGEGDAPSDGSASKPEAG